MMGGMTYWYCLQYDATAAPACGSAAGRLSLGFDNRRSERPSHLVWVGQCANGSSEHIP